MSDEEKSGAEAKSFGRFNVTGVLGQGGMGVVYHAQDPVIGRRVAIKVLRPDPGLDNEERQELQSRFEQEFRSAGTLSHPNVVTIYDVGKGDNEAAFIAMECVEGESLAQLLSSGKVLSFKEVCDLATQICSALDYAHQAGIVHRDIKPANILITTEGRPKITDFGVAKVVSANLTRTGTVIGTPTYMSPEQVTGQPITGGSDQWSIAVILYQMLTGELPFPGESPTTILYKIVHQDPIGPHALNRSLPEGVDRVLLRALRKSPSERYGSCTELADDLAAALGAAPMIPEESTSRTVTLSQSDIETMGDSYGGAASWWQRQEPVPRLGIAAGGAVVVMALGWFTMSLIADGDAEPPPPEPDVQAEPAAFAESLEISSDGAAGAEIWVDGVDSGERTPASIELTGRVGDPVRLELRRYAQVVAVAERTLDSELGRRWRPQELELPPETFTITSNPPGATVEVNGQQLAGTTPVQMDFEYGKRYNVFVRLPGYKERSWGFRFPDEGLTEAHLADKALRFNLPSDAPPGTVVARAPYEVILEAGGRRAGPSFEPSLQLPEGEYDVTITAPSVFFRSQRRGVRITSGETFQIPTLPEVRQVNVASYPANARVYINGDLAGEVPLTVRVTLGTHNFVFEFPDGREKRLDHHRITRTTGRVFATAPD